MPITAVRALIAFVFALVVWGFDAPEPPEEPDEVIQSAIGPGPGGPGGGGFAIVVPLTDWETRLNIQERVQSLGDDLMGDRIDPHTGAVEFLQTDIVLPGNSDLEVALRRRATQGKLYGNDEAEFGDWSYVVPRLTIVSAEQRPWTGARCTSDFASQFTSLNHFSNYYYRRDYTNGLMLEVGGTSEAVLESPRNAPWPSGASHVTNSYWYFTCLGAGSFIGHAPDGKTYRFDRFFVRDAMPLEINQHGLLPIHRDTYVLAASEVADRHGNWVRYDYDGAGRLTRIHANDGREITLAYSGASHLVQSATANGRTWTYSYRAGTGTDGPWTSPSHANFVSELASVTLPDGRAWAFSIGALQQSTPPSRFCLGGGQLAITHPDGVLGKFDLWLLKHRTSANTQISMPSQCPEWDIEIPPTGGVWPVTAASATPVFGVTRKELTAPDAPAAVWTFQYEQDLTAGTTLSDPTNWTRVTGPEGVRTFYHRWQSEMLYGGSLVREEVRATASGPALETIETEYAQESIFGFSAASDHNVPMGTVTRNKRVTRVERTRDGALYTVQNTYDTNAASPTYSFGAATSTLSSSNLPGAGQRQTQIDYLHDTSQWVIGLPTRVTRNGKVFEEIGYSAARLPAWIDHFGARVETRGYNTDGTLAWVRDGLNRQTSFSNWYRGHPRTITRADSSQIALQVDADGRITQITNARGHATSYGYNASGWLSSITPPSGFAATTISYANLGGGMVMTRTRGPQEIRTTHDRYHRPLEVRTRALSGGGATSFIRFAYDAAGRTVFESFPSSAAGATAGMETDYDALGRVIRTAETVSPYAQTLTAYLSGNRTQVTDPLGHVTITHATGYAGPGDGEPVRIDHPLGLRTDMTYDAWGNLLTARQWGTHSGHSVDETQSWAYDSRLRLCRHVTPQSGHTLYAYDAANQMTGVARGAPSGSGCASLPSALRVGTSYDLLGRIDTVDFPDSSPDIDFNHDANGNLTAANRGTTAWAYAYDAMDRLTSQVLTVDGRIYADTTSYTADGRLSTRNTPGGRLLDHLPNGLGQPTRARVGSVNYASGAVYTPSGQLAALSYSNGASYTASFDARQLLASMRVTAGAGDRLRFTYGRDALGRVSSITDHVVAGENRSFGYDALGRLISAGGPWGSGAYTYDLLNNVRAKTLGSRFVELEYDGAGRLWRYRDSAAGGAWRTQGYDGRGNTTSDGLHGFIYDRSERPVSISGAASGSFVYDAHGRRVKQVLAGETIYSVYGLGGTLLYRDNASTGERTDYIALGGHPVGRFDAAGGFTWTAGDHLGSASLALDGAAGVLWRESYTPFGEVRNNPAANRDEAGFTGHVRDQATGLTYAQARYYNPVTARFLSPDPVGFATGGPGYFNRYAYTMNDPVNLVDPSGEVWGKLARFGVRVVRTRGNVRAAGRQFATEVRRDAGILVGRNSSFAERAEAGFNLASPVSLKEIAAVGAGAASVASALILGDSDSGASNAELVVEPPDLEPILGEDFAEFDARAYRVCRERCIDAYAEQGGPSSMDSGSEEIRICARQCADQVIEGLDPEYFEEN